MPSLLSEMACCQFSLFVPPRPLFLSYFFLSFHHSFDKYLWARFSVCFFFFFDSHLPHTQGVQYEDLMNSSKPAVAEALELADPDVITGRMRRLKRASDLIYKGKIYTDYAPAMSLEQTFVEEIRPDVRKIEARNEEFAILNLHKK
jgi:hypothetical protein